MRLFEKCPGDMNLEEAEAAYNHAVRNLGFHEVSIIEQCPENENGDSAHQALCKKLYRRIQRLEAEE